MVSTYVHLEVPTGIPMQPLWHTCPPLPQYQVSSCRWANEWLICDHRWQEAQRRIHIFFFTRRCLASLLVLTRSAKPSGF